MTRITYYDYSNLYYAAIYLNGFMDLAAERGYQFAISRREPPELKGLEMANQWLPSRRTAWTVFRYERGTESFLFCIDTGDKNGDVEMGGIGHELLLEKCKYYFKVNYNAAAIAGNPRLAPYQEKIRPAPITFPVAIHQPWKYLPNINPLAGPVWPRDAIDRRIKGLKEVPKLDDYRRLRAKKKDIDAFFILPIRSEIDNPRYAEQNRRRKIIVEGLNQRKGSYNIVAGYIASGTHNEDPGPYVMPRTSLAEYLDLMSRTRIGIYVRGTDGCLSFKFGELMALGIPVVGETILNNTDNLYQLDYFDEQFAYDEPEDIVDQVFRLLDKPEHIEELKQANTETFENHLASGPIVAGILDQIEEKVSMGHQKVLRPASN